MSILVKLLTGAAGLAAVVGFASPAAAQYYPGYGYGNNHGRSGVSITIGTGQRSGYGQQYGYGQPYGYGQSYGYGQQYGGYGRGNAQYAASQCTRAVQARLGGGYGYGGGRVLGVTSVEPRNNGVRVRGVASSGQSGGYGYSNGGDLSFSCKVDYRGRIVDLNFNRLSSGYGYGQGYNNGYYRGY